MSEGRTDSANRRKRVSEWSIKARQPGDFVTERIRSTAVTCPSGEDQLFDGFVEIHRVAIESVHTARIYDEQHLTLIGKSCVAKTLLIDNNLRPVFCDAKPKTNALIRI